MTPSELLKANGVELKNITPDRHYATMWPCYHHSQVRWLDTCKTCGLAYVKEISEDRHLHRQIHRQVLSIYEPRPVPEIFGSGPFLEVTPASRKRVRSHLEGLARMFRRECGFDFPPYTADDETDEPARHFMLVAPDGRPIGGSSAQLRDCDDEIDASGSIWLMTWMFVIPSERRKGHMARTWDMMRGIIPDILPEPPFTTASATFFLDQTDVPRWVGDAARRALVEGLR